MDIAKKNPAQNAYDSQSKMARASRAFWVGSDGLNITDIWDETSNDTIVDMAANRCVNKLRNAAPSCLAYTKR